MNKIIPTNHPAHDSITVYLPKSKIEILDKSLSEEFYKYYLGEEYPEPIPNKPAPIQIVKNGYKMRIGFKALNLGGVNKEFSKPIECLSIVITTKLLGSDYWQGITSENLTHIHKELMKLNIFHCSFETLKNAKYSDHDICENRYAKNPESFLQILRDLKNQSGTKFDKFNLFPYIEKRNVGLDINTRPKGTPSQPYIKFYHKEFEITSEKNKEFYKKYLEKDYSESIKNLVRVEATIKNSPHRKRLIKKGIISEYKTLGEVLKMPIIEMHNFITSSLNEYIIKIQRKKSDKLNPTEHIICEMIKNQVQLGLSFDQILKFPYDYQGNNKEHTKKSKYRIKKLITKMFDLTIHNTEINKKSIQNKETYTFLKSFGIELI